MGKLGKTPAGKFGESAAGYRRKRRAVSLWITSCRRRGAIWYNHSMKKINIVLITVAAVLVLTAAGLLVWRMASGAPSFYAVSLRTGDVYFGHLTRFPAFGLKQVYVIQANQNSKENPFSVQRFKNVFWGPEDFLRINRDEVVWMVRLNPEGQLARLITENPELVSPPAASAPASVPQQQAESPEGK